MENDKPDTVEVRTSVKDRKRKSQEHDQPAKDSVLNTNGESGGTLANRKSPQGHKSKRQKGNNKSKKALRENPGALSMKSKNNQDGQNNGGASLDGQNTATDTKRRKSGNKDDVGFRKRKMQNQDQAGQKVSKKRPKKNKDSVGKDVVDKLDVLIEQYRSKFSHKGSQGSDGEKKPSKQLRKWFQS
ncbi:RNA-binding protein 28 isoform X1 [Spatholobus suberectus]|nr:RNA-binding protein 28 isoform X1 [Spatholobus suberectus]